MYKVKLFRKKCYFLYFQTVNRTNFSDQLAYGKMTLLNFSFMFGGIKLQVCSKTYQNVLCCTKPYLKRRDIAQKFDIMLTKLYLETNPIEQCEASASDFATQPRGQCETRIFEILEGLFVSVREILHVATLSRRRLSRENLLATFSIPKSRCIDLHMAVNYLFPPKTTQNQPNIKVTFGRSHLA